MGCSVEAAYHAARNVVVREQRVWMGGVLAAESLMAFAAA